MRFGTWVARSLYIKSTEAVGSELAGCKLDLGAVQEVRWVDGSSQPADDYIFFYGSGAKML